MDSENLTQGVEKTFKNDYFFWIVMLFGIVFGWLARPPIPNWLLNLFENPFFQYLVLFGIVYTGSKNVKAAFISPLIFMLLMYLFSLGDRRKERTHSEAFYNRVRGGYRETAAEEDGDEEEDQYEGDEEGEEDIINEDEVNEETSNENFIDQEVEQKRKRLAQKIHQGISNVSRSSSELYQEATDLLDTYSDSYANFKLNSSERKANNMNTTGNTTTSEGFYDLSACNSCMGLN